MTEKLQKVLARAGLGSRRKIETWIKVGRVMVNGKTAQLGDRVNISAKITYDGNPVKITQPQKNRVLLYNKPLGEVCTRSDEKGRRTVFDGIPSGRWVMIGRLDINSTGLLLFTNDGELAHALMHPSSELEREYLVRVHGTVTPIILEELRQGVMLEDGLAKFKSIHKTREKWYRVVITEGRNRLVRRLWQAKNISVNRLIRIRFCDILLPRSLGYGKLIELKAEEVEALAKLAKR